MAVQATVRLPPLKRKKQAAVPRQKRPCWEKAVPVLLELIAGDESEYGLYVKMVNGITADYDADGVYWAFYINGEYAATGVDSTPITEGESYSFKVE